MKAYRSSLFHFIADPLRSPDRSYQYFEDGLLIIDQGRVVSIGDYASLKGSLHESDEILDYSGHLIMPGFIDTHIHYSQTDVIASSGTQLLDWLQRFTFPVESNFSDKSYAQEMANFFVDELLRNGTTTAMVFPTVHSHSVDALFSAASKNNMRMISGKVLMDRNAPKALCDTPDSGYNDSKTLIQKWHNTQRLLYAITPRFAPTSTDQQLKMAGQLLKEFPDLYVQSHVAENSDEVEWVKKLFPWARSYLDVYDQYGLLSDRSVYAHCIYLNKKDRQRMSESHSGISFCPTSNLFLGSGLLDMKKVIDDHVQVSIGTDVGGGTSFNIFKTLNEAYKVCQLNDFNLSALQGFYMSTLGAAELLSLDDKIGSLSSAKEADFIVVDLQSTPLIRRRMKTASSIEDILFILMMMADDRNILETYIMGERSYQRDKE